MAASPQVEAKSLAALNLLAANPPRYPENPTGDRHESLVLYISRVPGTRDVILSPFKPQMKNVTGEDVANSLYYIHLDLPSDDLISPLAPPTPRRDYGFYGDQNVGLSSGESSSGGLARGHREQQQQQRQQEHHQHPAPHQPPAAIHRKPLPMDSKVPNLETHASEPVASTAAAGVGPSPSSAYQLNTGDAVGQPRASTRGPSIDGGDANEPGLATSRPPQGPQPGSAPVLRKPLGPRPMGAPAMAGRYTPPAAAPDEISHRPGVAFDVPPPPLPGPRPNPNAYLDDSPDQPTTGRQAWTSNDSRPPSPTTSLSRQDAATPFTLTLIRRDPTTGHQWNIGKVSSYQTSLPWEQAGDVSPPASKRHPPINIQLEASGYAKFRGMPTALDVGSFRPSSSDLLRPGSWSSLPRLQHNSSESRGSGPQMQHHQQQQHPDDSDSVFSRQVVMAYGKTWTSNIREALKQRRGRAKSTDSAAAGDAYDAADLKPPRPLSAFHVRNSSVHSAGSAESVVSGENCDWMMFPVGGGGGGAAGLPPTGQDSIPPPQIITQPGPGLRLKGYTFASPWDGLCEFRTGSGGRSLKCRHVASPNGGGGGGGGFNPLVLAQDLRDGNVPGAGRGSLAAAAAGALPVSELRFSLPSADLFRQREGAAHGELGLSSTFDRLLKLDAHNVLHRRRRGQHEAAYRSEDEYDDDDDDGPSGYGNGYWDPDEPMDLSLGRERAGGGNRGRRAKMGKLIVHDEGLKMLDLVVAANMGVWWGAWEKRA